MMAQRDSLWWLNRAVICLAILGAMFLAAVTGLGKMSPRRGSLGPVHRYSLVLESSRHLHPEIDSLQGKLDALQAKGEVLLASDDPKEALQAYSEALKLSQAINDRSREATALFGIARAERRRGNSIAALEAAEHALEVVEGAPGLWDRLDRRREFYAFAIDLLMEKHRVEPSREFAAAAFELSERARSRTLLEALNGPQGGADRSGSKVAAHSLKLQEIQELLGDDTLLLSYWLGEERSFLWVVGRDSIESRELLPRHEIEAAAARLYAALSTSSRRVPRASSELLVQTLGKMLLDPAAGVLEENRLAVISDGALQSIPFAVLPDPGHPSQPLIAEHETVLLPSASSLAAIRRTAERRNKPPNLLAVIGDPVFAGDDPRVQGDRDREESGAAQVEEHPRSLDNLDFPHLERLRYSREEAEDILRLVPPGSTSLRALGFQATRDLVTSGALSSYRLLHFATHGLFSDDQPDLSSLVLSMVDEEGRSLDGLLKASKIRNLDLPADLVVLSSCQTTRGRNLFRGEGQTLVRSFLEAGASRGVASLWSVDDQATAVLMTRFYEALLSRELAPAAALREAQLSMLREPRWSAPVYWAGFVLEGDWK